jgi:ParB-like nuclease domain
MNLAQRIELWPVDRLKPYERNARTHSPEQVAKIAASITEFGFTNPILVDSADGIIAGHGRLMAAQQLGLADVPVIVLDHLSDAQRRAYILADNRLAELAGWDNGMLAGELLALKDDGFDLDLAGFSDDDLAELLGEQDIEQLNPQADPDDVPDEPVRPVSLRGDLWKLGRHRLICGDSTSMADVEAVAGIGHVECLWTDQPYNVAYEGTAGSIKNDDMEESDFQQFLLDAFVTAFAVMKPGGAAYVAHADTNGSTSRSSTGGKKGRPIAGMASATRRPFSSSMARHSSRSARRRGRSRSESRPCWSKVMASRSATPDQPCERKRSPSATPSIQP